MIPLSCIGWFDEVKKELKEEKKTKKHLPDQNRTYIIFITVVFFILILSSHLPTIIHPSRFLHHHHHLSFQDPTPSHRASGYRSIPPWIPFCIFKFYNRAKKTTSKWMQIHKSIAAKDTEETDKTSTTKCTITGTAAPLHPGMDIKKNWRTIWEVRYMLIREDASFPSSSGTKILIFSGQNINYICKNILTADQLLKWHYLNIKTNQLQCNS